MIGRDRAAVIYLNDLRKQQRLNAAAVCFLAVSQ